MASSSYSPLASESDESAASQPALARSNKSRVSVMVETLTHWNPPCATMSTRTDCFLGVCAALELAGGGEVQENRFLKVTRPALDLAASQTAV